MTDAIIAAAERRLGVRLPPRYLELLRVQNGGYTKDDLACPLVEDATRIDDCITLRALNGIVPDGDIATGGIHNILLSEYMTKE